MPRAFPRSGTSGCAGKPRSRTPGPGKGTRDRYSSQSSRLTGVSSGSAFLIPYSSFLQEWCSSFVIPNKRSLRREGSRSLLFLLLAIASAKTWIPRFARDDNQGAPLLSLVEACKFNFACGIRQVVAQECDLIVFDVHSQSAARAPLSE